MKRSREICIRTVEGRVLCGPEIRGNPPRDNREQLDLFARPPAAVLPPSPHLRSRGGVPRVVGLFAGIGGLELGMHAAGFQPALLCEWSEPAQRVLAANFPGVPLVGDVRSLDVLPPCDVLTAGFPCKDISAAGKDKTGLAGAQSGLVREVFRLLRTQDVPYVVIENVRQMLSLDGGAVMQYITRSFEELGYRWAYRLIDTRCFGLPQRRERVYFVASRGAVAPEDILFADDAGDVPEPTMPRAYGFSWQEGTKGLGWVPDGVPTLRCGSSVGVPSPPAVWIVGTGEAGTIQIVDAERLQGFPGNWTLPSGSIRERWRQVGNAVSVPVSTWIAHRIASPAVFHGMLRPPRARKGVRVWSNAECSSGVADLSACPVHVPMIPILQFLTQPLVSLTQKQASGFLGRVQKGVDKKTGLDLSTATRKEFLSRIHRYSCTTCG